MLSCCCSSQVVQQCVGTEGVEPEYIKTEVLPEFFRCFWQRRMALDRRNYRALVETTVSLAQKVSDVTVMCKAGLLLQLQGCLDSCQAADSVLLSDLAG